jgi:hypothetical protein
LKSATCGFRSVDPAKLRYAVLKGWIRAPTPVAVGVHQDLSERLLGNRPGLEVGMSRGRFQVLMNAAAVVGKSGLNFSKRMMLQEYF